MIIRGDGDPPIYGPDSEDFTLKFYYGGKFEKIGGTSVYVGGDVGFVDECHRDYISILDIQRIAGELGVEGETDFYFEFPCEEDGNDIIKLVSDIDVLRMMSYANKVNSRELTVYICEGNGFTPSKDEHVNFIDSDYEDGGDDEPVDVNVEFKTEIPGTSFRLDDDHEEDELGTVVASVDEEARPLRQYREFNPTTEIMYPRFFVGQVFGTAKQFKDAVKEYIILNGREIKFVKNDKNRVRARCRADCPWRIHASFSVDRQSFQVKTYIDEHNCGRVQKVKYADALWISKRYLDQFKNNPKMPISAMIDTIKKDYILSVSKGQVYRAKKLAASIVPGTHDDQFAKMWEYCEELRRSNKGSTMRVTSELGKSGIPVFQRFYLCLGALKKGFIEGCRPIIGFDGFHVNGSHPGHLLVAVGIDGDNSMYPVCWAVVEAENRDSWEWFLKLVMEDLQVVSGHQWTVISGRQNALVLALEHLVPNASHRFCVRHLYNDFKDLHKGMCLKQTLWSAARACTVNEFEIIMERLRNEDNSAYEWLTTISPTAWSRAFFSPDPKCDILLNDICVSVYGCLLDSKDKPLIQMLEMIRLDMMHRLIVKREGASKWAGNIGPNVSKIIEKNKGNSRCYSTVCVGDNKFHVSSALGFQFTVDLVRQSCSCRRWDLSGIPCPHAISAIFLKKEDPEAYVSHWYTKEFYMKAYEPFIHPTRGQDLSPKKLKRRAADESPLALTQSTTKLGRAGLIMKCRLCGQDGHNKRTCSRRQSTSQISSQSKRRSSAARKGNDETPKQSKRRRSAATKGNDEVPTQGITFSATSTATTTTTVGTRPRTRAAAAAAVAAAALAAAAAAEAEAEAAAVAEAAAAIVAVGSTAVAGYSVTASPSTPRMRKKELARRKLTPRKDRTSQ